MPLSPDKSSGITALLLATAAPALACDLCAIYRAADARGEYSTGWTVTVAEQFTRLGTEQFNGTEFHRANGDWLDRSMTHLVAGWNFAEHFGVSANLPLVHLRYRFVELRDGVNPVVRDGSDFGLGDLALVGRWQIVERSDMEWGATINLLGGVKLPTGASGRLEELEQSIDRYEAIVGPGHQHDALGNIISGIHVHDITLGSGSVDGIVGIAGTFRWQRAFLNLQGQYYLRSEGAGDYQFANELILSGGPGAFLWLEKNFTVSLQLAGTYDTRGADRFRGRESVHTGATVAYLGPQVGFTWKSRLSVLAGADLPVLATARGFQNVPDFRLNTTVTWAF